MRAHTSRKSVLVAFALALGLTGCASGGGGGGSTSSRNVLSQSDLVAQGEVDLFEAIQRLRRAWLTRSPGELEAVVYVDNVRRGGLNELRTYSVRDVGQVEYVDGINATTRYGLDHGGGVILVSTGVPETAVDAGGGTSGGNERPRDTSNTRAAEDALEDEDYARALASAEAAIAENPQNPLGHRLAALAHMELGNYQEAGEHFDHAGQLWSIFELEDAPIREQTFIDLYQEAIPQLNAGDFDAASVTLENAHAVYSQRPEAMITLAQIYAQNQETERSLAYIDEATTFLQSEYLAEVDTATARAWREQGEGLPLMRAQVLVGAGRFEEAVGTYREIAAANPGDLSIRQDLAAILMQMGESDQALAEYDELMQQPGLGGYDFYRIGAGFYQAEDYGRAAEAFGRGVEVSPMDRDNVEMWARSLQLDSMYAEVVPAAERWMELDPNSQIAITVLAQAVNAQGDGQRAGEIIALVDELPVAVQDLSLRRGPDGGGTVNGSLINKTLQQGAQVTLTFTFYSEAGSPLGTVTHRASVGAPDMANVFSVQFDSAETLGGYGYELSEG